uniref:polynucleotide adenylyltransferase n=1 Tax=Periophthalmus magnuspinnatus TaxID=409849 RepID=A0A3B4BF86_9GOBI
SMHFQSYDGPQSLPAYQWKPTSNPVYTVGPPGANSRNSHKAKHAKICPILHCLGIRFEFVYLFGVMLFQVSAQIVELFEACRQQSSDLYRKETCRAQLQKDIKTLYPDARLYLTGSTMSGLGCRSSDADLCLVVGNYHTILLLILPIACSTAYVDRVLLIRAKVPILRFKEKGSNLEFDLNVNNTVGIRNTFLLRTDIRIQPLMLVIKKWARTCEINDASKGTLSSYALALMALNYLQILKPCVLPSLQRDHPACFDPSLDLDMVPDASHRVPHYKSKNKSSLGDLFLGFLKYYAYKFRVEFLSVHEKAKFDAIKARFDESYQILNEARDLSLLLPLRAIIHKEQIGR